MSNSLIIMWEDHFVGRLWQDSRRDFSFQYESEWLSNSSSAPLSVRLPLQKNPFPDHICRFFFSNLLPEGNIRTLVARKLGISEANDFELLKAIGGDCAGAISILAEDQVTSQAGDYWPLSTQDLKEMIENRSKTPLLIWKDELRLSLAGAQQKLPVYFEDGRIYLPRGVFASSHILKPRSSHFEHLVENEAFCMNLAKRCELNVPNVVILNEPEPLYLIERYDRRRDAQGRLTRLHQEDFCQALGFRDTQKYESEGGPNLKGCFNLLSEHGTQPLVDKKKLLEWIVFNTLIGNCDAHAKNLSMLITKEDYRLAPFYDLVSTKVYPSLSQKLAMKIGGESRLDWILKEQWEKCARDAEVGPKAIINICQRLYSQLPEKAQETSQEFRAQTESYDFIMKICNHIELFSKKMIQVLEH